MHPGQEVEIVKGEHQGKRAKIKGTDGWFYHVQLLTNSGRKQVHGLATVHRSAISEVDHEA